MSAAPLSLELREFIQQRVRSIEGLEALLLLHREPTRTWSEPELAQQLGMERELLRERLTELAQEGLLRIGEGEPPSYRYQLSDPVLEPLVAQLATAYSTKRVDVLVFIATSAMDRVRSSALHTFSEAFRLRGPKKNG